MLIAVLHKGAPPDDAPILPSGHPRAALIQLGDHVFLMHPTLDQLHARSAFTAWPRPLGDIEAGGEASSLGHAEWFAPPLEREASL